MTSLHGSPGGSWRPITAGMGSPGMSPRGSYYWFWDYVADVDALIEHIGGPVDLVGHSMGGTIASLYAGARPDRVRRLVLIEGLGPPDSTGEAVSRARAFLKERRDPPRHKAIADIPEAAARMRLFNPNIAPDAAARLGERLVRDVVPGDVQVKDPHRGGLVWTWDAVHRGRSPLPFQASLFKAFLGEIRAPTLIIDGGASPMRALDVADRVACLADAQTLVIPGAGHLVHVDQPEALAGAIARFLG